MRGVAVLIAVAVSLGVAPTAGAGRATLLARATHPIVTFDANAGWIAWAEDGGRCERIYRQRRGRPATRVRFTTCRRGVSSLELTGSRLFWTESHRPRSGGERSSVLTATRPRRVRVLATTNSAGVCGSGVSLLRGSAAAARIFAYQIMTYDACVPPVQWSVWWVDGLARHPRPRLLTEREGLWMMALSGRRIALVPWQSQEPSRLEIRDAFTGEVVDSADAPERGLYDVAYGGRYVAILHDDDGNRAVELDRFDTRTDTWLGGEGAGGDDDEFLGPFAMTGRHIVGTNGRTIYSVDAATGRQRTVHATRAWTVRPGLSVFGSTVAWRTARAIYAHPLPRLPRLADRG